MDLLPVRSLLLEGKPTIGFWRVSIWIMPHYSSDPDHCTLVAVIYTEGGGVIEGVPVKK